MTTIEPAGDQASNAATMAAAPSDDGGDHGRRSGPPQDEARIGAGRHGHRRGERGGDVGDEQAERGHDDGRTELAGRAREPGHAQEAQEHQPGMGVGRERPHDGEDPGQRRRRRSGRPTPAARCRATAISAPSATSSRSTNGTAADAPAGHDGDGQRLDELHRTLGADARRLTLCRTSSSVPRPAPAHDGDAELAEPVDLGRPLDGPQAAGQAVPRRRRRRRSTASGSVSTTTTAWPCWARWATWSRPRRPTSGVSATTSAPAADGPDAHGLGAVVRVRARRRRAPPAAAAGGAARCRPARRGRADRGRRG